LGKDAATIARLGRLAKAAAERLAPPGTPVRVETDVQTRDRYGRLLAYVFLRNGRIVNEEVVRQGGALVLTIPPNSRHVARGWRAWSAVGVCRRAGRGGARGRWCGGGGRWCAASAGGGGGPCVWLWVGRG